MASAQPKIISLVNQRKAPSWANTSPSARATSPTARATSPTARATSPMGRSTSPMAQRSVSPADPVGRTASPGGRGLSPGRRGSDSVAPARDPPPATPAEDFPSGATKYTGGSTFQRTTCTTHKYGAK
eukprot:EG_transcript_34300